MKKIYLYSTFVLLFTLSSCSGMTTGNTFTFSADENNAVYLMVIINHIEMH